MAEGRETATGIFISYRRSDSPDATGRIYDRLVADFGKAQVFKDVDSIPLGMDFRGHLNAIVGGCAVVLAIIGPGWTDVRSSDGQRRLEDPDDFVRIELEAALARGIPVVPVLVGNATMPGVAQLPPSLAELAYRQSIQVRPDPDFHNDATRLLVALQAILDPDAPKRPAPSQANSASGAPLKWTIALAAASLLVTALLAIPALSHLRETPPAETRLDVATPVTDDAASFALSPDGRQIVFVGNEDGTRRLWLRSLSSPNAQPLAGTDGATQPFWSPDSRSIGFNVSGSIKRVNLEGGLPQTLVREVTIGQGGTWSAKGDILFPKIAAGPLFRVAAGGGSPAALPFLGEELGNSNPLFLPDDEHFLFLARTLTEANLYLGSLNGKTAVRLTTDVRVNTTPAYLPSGWALWIRADGTLVAQRLDIAKASLVGEAVTIADGVLGVSASSTGMVAYRAGAGAQRQLTWVDRTGTVRGTVGPTDGLQRTPRVSADGQVAYARTTDGKNDIWLQGDTRASRMTFEIGSSDFPVWSPDGSRIVYVQSQVAAIAGIFEQATDGSRARESLLQWQRPAFPTSWSGDGRYLLYFQVNPGPGIDLWVIPMTGERKSFAFLQSAFTKVWAQFSPDGRWVAYGSNESGRGEIYLRRFLVPGAAESVPERDGQWQVSTAGGVFPLWRADGRELYYIDPSGMLMAVPIHASGSVVTMGTPSALFQTNVQGGGSDANDLGRQYDVAPDGRFLINRVLDTANSPITIIQNWKPHAK